MVMFSNQKVSENRYKTLLKVDFREVFPLSGKKPTIPLMSLLTLDFYFNRTSQDLVESLHIDAMINALSSQNAL